MADINDRLERLNRREEFARRGHHGGLLPPTPDVELDDDFAEVLVAVARVVQRHPGLSVMVAAADGRPGRTVIRVTERDGSVETAVVPPPGPVRSAPAAAMPAAPVAPPPLAAVPSEPEPVAPAASIPALATWAAVRASQRGRHSDDRYEQYQGDRLAAGQYVARPFIGGRATESERYESPVVDTPYTGESTPAVRPFVPEPIQGPPPAITDEPVRPEARPAWYQQPPVHSLPPEPFPSEPYGSGPFHGPAQQYDGPPEARDYGYEAGPEAGEPEVPPGYQEAPPGGRTRGLVTLTDETSAVVARLAQMLRDDPSLASRVRGR